ncbi:MAG: metal ABC transporter permease [Bifidobacterium sp.]|jgi:zinc/manganese transport system permease protein|nr:metal ABC transporter permease [Bifidobacterium sp.]
MNVIEALWQVQELRIALIVGSTVAVSTAFVGVFTVLRGQSFAGHSLTDLASVGGSAAFLLGVNQLWGFLVGSVLAALGMHWIGVERLRGRDVATGIVLGTGMGFTSLFLTLATMRGGSGGSAAVSILFGSLFAIDPRTVPIVVVLSVVCVLALAMMWKQALFTTVSPQLASAKGVRINIVNALFMCVLGIAVALGSISVGAVLSTALLIGPAACGLAVSKRMRDSVAVACSVGLACVWAGVVVSYESYSWTRGHSWSVSFCIVALVLVCYLLCRGIRMIMDSRMESGVAHV